MPEKRVADLLDMRNRFLRSAHLERDFRDPAALSGYVVTDFARSCIGRMANGLKPRSGNRAWRMTGDYGSGKSSFALLLAHWFAGHDAKFPPPLRKAVDPQQFGVARPRFLPVLVTCSRQALGVSVVRALYSALIQLEGVGARSKIAGEVQRLNEAKRDPSDDEVFDLILSVNSRLVTESKAKGLLLILDELGKFLEFASLHPERQDVFLLQRLAEAASRSAEEPFFIVSLQHQGFNAYTDRLNQSAQREWEKVAGRFEEIVFNPPFEQAASIISSAINVRVNEIPRSQAEQLREAMERTLALGWLGAAPSKGLVEAAPRLYPLHPTVMAVLIRTFRRFGQNERSLFSFLLSNEPFGLQAFAQRIAAGNELYRLHDLYDYVRTNFGHRLSVQSYRSHWNLIDSVVESFVEENEAQLKILKTIGILNLLNDSDLLATEESVVCALAGGAEDKTIRSALSALHKHKRIISDRGRARGLCLWPHTSVDLEKVYEDACRAIDAPQNVASLIRDSLDTRPIVARRHYIETGNLRHADVRYCPVKDLHAVLQEDATDADGLIIVRHGRAAVVAGEPSSDPRLSRKRPGPGHDCRLAGCRPHVCHPMKASTIHGIHSILSGAFAAAQRWEWTDRNPTMSAKPPTTIRRSIPATSPDDVAEVIAEVGERSVALGLYLWLVVVTGVRRGELCGLQLSDIDLDRGLVHVAFNYVVRGGQRVRKDTKTHQDRWLAIDPDTCALIASYLDEIRTELATVGVELGDDAYLFSNDPAHARPWNPNWVTHQIAAAADAAEVKLDIKGGRHCTASQLLAGGFACATPPRALATAAAAGPRCGTMPTRSPRSTGEPPPISPS